MNNEGFALKSFLVAVALLMTIVLTVYLVRDEGSQQTTSVADFYSEYIRHREIDDEMMTDDLAVTVRNNEVISLLCTESFPEEIAIEMIEERENSFAVHLNHLNGPILVTMDENGKMARIDCPFEEEIAIEAVVDEIIEVEDENENEQTIVADIPPVSRAKGDLANRLGINTTEIELKSAEMVIFSDWTLGMSVPGEVYDQKLTPGHLIFLSANGNDYRYHADETRTIFIP